MKKIIKRIMLPTLAAIFMLALPALIGGNDLITLLRSTTYPYLLAFIILIAFSWASRIISWKILLSTQQYQLSNKSLFTIILASQFATENTPAGMGGVAAGVYFFKQRNIPPTTSLALGSLLVVMDVSAVFLLLTLATLLSLANNYPLAYWQIYAGITLILAGLCSFYLLFRHPHNVIQWSMKLRWPNLIPKRFRQQAISACQHLALQLKTTGQIPFSHAVQLFILSFLYWGICLSLLVLAIHALGGQTGWGATLLIQFISGLAGLFTFLPGGFPAKDVTIIALLSSLQMKMAVIMSALLLWRLATFHVRLLVGGIAFLYLTLKEQPTAQQPGSPP